MTTLSSNSLRPYVSKIGSLSAGPQFTQFITSLLNDPEVYVFGEVVENDNVKSLSTSDDNSKKSYSLLELFAYGKYSDFKGKEKELPALTDQQLSKLRHLTIISMAQKKRELAYTDLMSELGLPSVHDVESLIISSVYHGILVGKLNSEKQQLVVETTLGRDVRPHEIDVMIKSLADWQKQSALVLKNLEERVAYSRQEHESVTVMKNEHARQMGEIKATIKMLMEAEMENQERGGGGGLLGQMMGYGMMGGDFEDPRKRGHQGGKDKKDKGGKKHM